MSILAKAFRKLKKWHWVYTITKKHRKKMHARVKGYVLTKEQEEAARKFFAPYAKIDLSSHNYYTEKTGQFYPNYMPTDLYYTCIDSHFNNWWESAYVDNKCFYRRIFRDIKQPDEVACRIGGLWYDGNSQLVKRQDLHALLSKEPEIVVKAALSSYGGQGVHFMPGSEFTAIERKYFDDGDDIVIQRPLQQHPDLAAINASSVNTIRIMSLLSEEGVKVYSAILRIGIGGARVDNATSGGITCGITADGKLRKYAYATAGTRYETHPTSGNPFEGTQIPCFDKCVAAVSQLHLQIPRFHLVSWDFSVDPAGDPVLIEANMHYGGIDIHQLNNGPIFGEDTEKILKLIFGKK